MTELLTQLVRITDEACNPGEFLIVGLQNDGTDGEMLELSLLEWANAKGHTLRAPGARNPFRQFTRDDSEAWLRDSFCEDMVFRTKESDDTIARRAAADLIACIGPASYQWSDFTIDDWTFCDVLVITQRHQAIVIAFMGED